MSKIDDYKKARREADIMKEFVEDIRDQRCDKLGVNIKLEEHYLGYFGNSSTHSWPSVVVENIKIEMKRSIRIMAGNALLRLEAEAEKKRIEARDEAAEILRDIDPKKGD